MGTEKNLKIDIYAVKRQIILPDLSLELFAWRSFISLATHIIPMEDADLMA